MAFYQALQRKDGRFDYTCTNSAGTFPLGYCAGWNYDEMIEREQVKGDPMDLAAMLERERERTLPFRDRYHSEGHATAEEAHACHIEYLLDQHLTIEVREDEMLRCKECAAFTQQRVVINNHGYPREIPLCEQHQARELILKNYRLA